MLRKKTILSEGKSNNNKYQRKILMDAENKPNCETKYAVQDKNMVGKVSKGYSGSTGRFDEKKIRRSLRKQYKARLEVARSGRPERQTWGHWSI